MSGRSEVDSVIFDVGNVLLRFDYLIAARRLADEGGLDELPAAGPIAAAKAELEGGRIDRVEFLRIARSAFQHSGTDESFLKVWRDIFTENLPMTRFATELSERGVPTYLLSNISCIHVDHILRTYPVFGTVRDAVYSYQVGALKPEGEIHERAICQFGINPGRAVFVDDLAENIAAAEAAGLRGLVYDWRNHEPAERTIRGMLGIAGS